VFTFFTDPVVFDEILENQGPRKPSSRRESLRGNDIEEEE